MDFEELVKFVVLVLILQGAMGVIFFLTVRSTPGVDFGRFSLAIALLVLIAVIVGVFLYWLVGRYVRERSIKTAMMAMSDDEEEVLGVVMDEGEIRQDDLRRELDFSKSKLSALLNNLEEKNAIEKSRYRRTNKIKPTEEYSQ